MEVLFYFLNWTASFSHIDEETGSKMDAHNLATVITPNILYIKEGGHEQGDAYFLSIESVNTLIEEQSRFAEVPVEVQVIYRESGLANASADITSKDVISKVEACIKQIGGVDAVVVNNSTSPSSGSTTPQNLEEPHRPLPIRVNTSDIAALPVPGQEASIKRVNKTEMSPVSP
ncbi:Lrg1p [Sugiyamaella lignohabitans]|uniref:Lrg1p n=1 Tax=Sugiyamaella lignohabitans TaxID=796027 RepID=A0A161HG70_9ASCO|nr:Lrg1p [Sugiyamaella lignohabitans]ANB14680.1 Lrg1p [Sugiyamaella lignohabitans]